MLFFGSISAGGSGGGNYWQLNGATPNTISNTPDVTGIVAPNPTDPNLFLLLDDFLLPKGNAYNDGVDKFGFAGVVKQGNYVSLLAMTDTATGNQASINVEDNFNSSIENKDNVNNIKHRSNFCSFGVDRLVTNHNTNDNTQETQDITKFQKVVTTAGVISNFMQFDKNSFLLNGGGNTTFEVAAAGEITTNQIGPGVFIPTNDSILFITDDNGNKYQIQATLIP